MTVRKQGWEDESGIWTPLAPFFAGPDISIITVGH